MASSVHETVRRHYADAALRVLDGSTDSAACCTTEATACCAPATNAGAQLPASESTSCCGSAAIGAGLYDAVQRAELPDAAVMASLGCGNPTAVAELNAGEVVLDLGSGGGIDVLLSARRVGPSGRAIGLDMTDEMLALARANAVEAGLTNVDFVKGQIESIPLPAESVDVVISNCVIHRAADKQAVFGEIARVLRPGGRIGITDIVADDALSAAERTRRGSYAGCIAGALSFAEYEAGLTAAGLTGVLLTPTHEVVPGMHSVIIRAARPRA